MSTADTDVAGSNLEIERLADHRASPQGATRRVIHASPETVWAILVNSSRLPEWMTLVKSTDGGTEAVGVDRICEVQMGRRRGRVHERCVAFEPTTRIGWYLVADTLGFSRMLADFSFDFALTAVGDGTLVINTTYYRTTGRFARAMSTMMLRRKFARVRRDALENLAVLALQGDTGQASDAFTPTRRTHMEN